jgi:hypothetical protein
MKFYRCYELATNKPEWSRIKPPGIVQAVFIAPGVRPRLPGVYRLAFGPACQESTVYRLNRVESNRARLDCLPYHPTFFVLSLILGQMRFSSMTK